MNELSPDVTEDVTTPLVEAETTTDQEASQVPVSEDAADATENEEVVKSRGQQRIEQLVAEKNAALEDKQNALEYGNSFKDRYDQLIAAQAPAKVEPVLLTMPTLEDSDFDEADHALKMRAFNNQEVTRLVKELVPQVLNTNSQQVAQDQAAIEFKTRSDKFAETNTDFNSVVSNPNLAITSEMTEVIKTSSNGPELAYHLGKNPSEASRIAQLSPSMQMFEMGKVEASLGKPAKKETSKAPDPMSPVGGQQPNLSKVNETVNDYIKRRRGEQKEQRARR